MLKNNSTKHGALYFVKVLLIELHYQPLDFDEVRFSSSIKSIPDFAEGSVEMLPLVALIFGVWGEFASMAEDFFPFSGGLGSTLSCGSPH